VGAGCQHGTSVQQAALECDALAMEILFEAFNNRPEETGELGAITDAVGA
jgi:hypothetical protein